MPIFMQYGSSVQGDSTSQGHIGWIVVDSLSWGVNRAITSSDAKDVKREGTTPNVHEIMITKVQDQSSPNLMRASLAGGPAGQGQTVQIDITMSNASGSGPETYLSFTLTNTLISGYSLSTGGDRPRESLTLNFTQIACTTTQTTSANDPGSPDTLSYNLATQTLG